MIRAEFRRVNEILGQEDPMSEEPLKRGEEFLKAIMVIADQIQNQELVANGGHLVFEAPAGHLIYIIPAKPIGIKRQGIFAKGKAVQMPAPSRYLDFQPVEIQQLAVIFPNPRSLTIGALAYDEPTHYPERDSTRFVAEQDFYPIDNLLEDVSVSLVRTPWAD